MLTTRFKSLIVFCLFVLMACNNNSLYEENMHIPKLNWDAKEPVVFNVDILDTLNAYSIYVNVRNSSNYEMKNLFLFIQTTSPSGATLRDTFECMLADDRGKWLGSGWGDIYDNRFVYKKNIRFPLQGTYSVEITQAMRTEQLTGISDVGIRIEKSYLK
ncbi:MAG: hypothetical protein A2041_08390 [Bacteroidetes bacterium GWA2_31_9b]|nr:MAG: hypothetical protein A2041_08390 [Bacteroidetes bacterium GWA2_31_9b]